MLNLNIDFVMLSDTVRLPHQVEGHPVAPLLPLPLPSHQPLAGPVAVQTLKPAEVFQLRSEHIDSAVKWIKEFILIVFFWAF